VVVVVFVVVMEKPMENLYTLLLSFPPQLQCHPFIAPQVELRGHRDQQVGKLSWLGSPRELLVDLVMVVGFQLDREFDEFEQVSCKPP
jgi:hypothetical protein